MLLFIRNNPHCKMRHRLLTPANENDLETGEFTELEACVMSRSGLKASKNHWGCLFGEGFQYIMN